MLLHYIVKIKTQKLQHFLGEVGEIHIVTCVVFNFISSNEIDIEIRWLFRRSYRQKYVVSFFDSRCTDIRFNYRRRRTKPGPQVTRTENFVKFVYSVFEISDWTYMYVKTCTHADCCNTSKLFQKRSNDTKSVLYFGSTGISNIKSCDCCVVAYTCTFLMQ